MEAELEVGRRNLQQLEARSRADAEARRAELTTLELQQRRLQDDIVARRQADERLAADASAQIAAARRGVQTAEEQVVRARQRLAAEAAERQRRDEEARRVAQARQPVIPPGTEKRVALVVGNAAYRDRPLTNPVNDAQLMQGTLRELGFDVQVATDVDRRGLLGALREFEAKARGADVAFFYYAGHGAQVSGANYLIPLNAPIRADSDVPDEAVDASSVLRRIEDARAKVGLVVLDACRDNPYPGASRSSTRGLARMNAPTGTIVAYATAPGSTAEDGSGANSPYTATLAQQLRVPGLDVKDIFDRTAQEVERLTNGKQRPREEIALRGRFVLLDMPTATAAAVVPAATPAVVSAAAPAVTPPDPDVDLWELAKRRDNAVTYEAYLQAFPQGRYVAAARAALSSLRPATVATAAAPSLLPATPGRRGGEVFKDCADCPEMVVIPAGRFLMGSPPGEVGRFPDEGPQRWVDVSRFALGKYEVTQGEWTAVMGSNPSHFSGCGMTCPVENVSWSDAQEFARRLSQRTGQNYRLPSEAEWEYAARAGTTTAYFWGDVFDSSLAAGNGRQTVQVGSFSVNPFGLYDMHGNVWEWVQDVWNDSYTGAPSDSSSRLNGGPQSRRVLRGGSWGNTPQDLRAASRNGNMPDGRVSYSGLRIAKALQP